MQIRTEKTSDRDQIREVIRAAFSTHPRSSHNEQSIVDALRAANALTLSLVAVDAGEILGFVACSPVTIDGTRGDWHGLGPIAVRPDRQRRGVGTALMHAGIDSLKACDAKGIVLLGAPEYYGRFGFKAHSELQLPTAPAGYFLSLTLKGPLPRGVVAYHPAFGIA